MAVSVALLVSLSGCTVQPSPTPSAAEPSPSSSEPPTVQISLDDGDLLDPAQTASWADPLDGAAGYTVVTADDGDGSWSYRSEATDCVVGYWHGALPDSGEGDGDAADSDLLLAAQFGTTAEEIASFARDDLAPFRTPSELVQTRAVAGADSETATTYLVAARAFAALDMGFVATLRCPSTTDVRDMWALLSSDPNAFQLVFSGTG
ncbi:hypothetical protein EV279_2198 [Microbacterium sp. BK668]|nr:hypothetical protein EV279_2198 [Microbacterium sp. BK668]